MEEFKKIDGYDNYEVSNLGNVRNIDTGKVLKPCINSCGYYIVNLYKDRNRKFFYTHRLIALYFIPNPENLPCIDHIDRDRTNNSISNLRWISKSNNNRNRTKMQNTSSKFIGVCFEKARGKYRAAIRFDNNKKCIGYYEKEEDAGLAFDNFVKQHNLTEFYDLNFPDDVTDI